MKPIGAARSNTKFRTRVAADDEIQVIARARRESLSSSAAT
jgi:hypothetical protein